MQTPRSAAAAAISATILFSILCTASAQALVPFPAAPAPSFSSPEPFPPSSAPGPATTTGVTDCLTPLANMSDCLNYVTEGSKTRAPDENCCPEVAGLVDSNPICLCQLLSNSSLAEDFGIKIDIRRALKLPSVCRIATPPVSTCAAIGYPIPPIASEGPMANTGPTAGRISPPSGLASSPSAGDNANGASSSIISSSALSFLTGLAFSILLTFF